MILLSVIFIYFIIIFVFIIYLSSSHHLIVVERFGRPGEPESYVVWSFVLLVGSPFANWSREREQAKNGSNTALWPGREKAKGAHPDRKATSR